MTDRPSPDAVATPDMSVLLRRLAGPGKPRIAGLILLCSAAAAAEGAGLVLLAPMLGLLGASAEAPGSPGMGASAVAPPFLSLETALLIYMVIVLTAAAVIRARSISAARLRIAVTDGLRQELHAAILNLGWPAFRKLRISDVTHVVMEEISRVGMAADRLVTAAAALMTLPALLAASLYLSPAMTAVAVVAVAAAALLSRPLDRRAETLGRGTGEAFRGVNADLADDLAGFRIVKAFGAEAARRRRFADRTAEHRRRQLDFAAASAGETAAIRAAGAAAAAVGLAVAVRGFDMAMTDALVLVLVFGRIVTVGLRLQQQRRQILNALPALGAVEDLLARCRAEAEPPAVAVPPPQRELRLENVTVRYDAAAPPALSAVSLTIPAGAMVAVVGPSGAGKSTLADVLTGLRAPDEGSLSTDGIPLDDAMRRGWRRNVGCVPQEGFLFHDTIRANLTDCIDLPAADDEALRRALDAAAAGDFVAALPDGTDTVVGDRGARLSGGERQRLTLARALLARPRLLVLDEPTGALDAESERRVRESLDRLRGRVTLVVIAHRLSTVRGADMVAVLDAGRLIVAGDWVEATRIAGPLLDRLDMAP